MARLTDVSQQQRPVPRVVGQASRAPVLRGAVVGGVGPGIRNLGGSLEQAGDEIFRVARIEEDRINTVRAEEAYNVFLEKKTELTFGDGGFSSLKGGDAVSTPVLKDFSQKLADSQRAIGSSLSNDLQRQLFNQRANVGSLQFKEDILRHLSVEGARYSETTYTETIEFERRAAQADWAKPKRVDTNIARIKATIIRRAEDQGWTAEQRQNEIDVEISKVHSSVAQSMMLVSPLAARRYMDDHEEEIDPNNFTILRGKYVSELDRIDRLADKQLKEDQDLFEETRLLAILDGEGDVDLAIISADLASNNLRREGFTRLKKALDGEGITNDVEVQMRLDDMAGKGEETVIDEIVQAVDDRSLKPDTGATIFRRFLATTKAGGVLAREDVKRARAFVDELVGGVRGPLAILDPAESERVARAKVEFDRRITQALDADPHADPTTIANDVVKRFRLSAPILTSFPRLRFLVGSRREPDFTATRNATLDALASRQITSQEAALELQTLEDIKAAVDLREEMRRDR